MPFYLKNNKYKMLKITAIVTFLIYLLLFIINYVNLGNWLLNSYLIASFVLIFLWIDVLICTFTKIPVSYKISLSLLLLACVTAFTNSICEKVLNIPNNESNYPNIICAIIMVVLAFGILLQPHKKKF